MFRHRLANLKKSYINFINNLHSSLHLLAAPTTFMQQMQSIVKFPHLINCLIANSLISSKAFGIMWQLALGLLQQLTAAPAIVVERNMFAYYKVPVQRLEQMLISSNHLNNNTDLYFILQCPPKLDDNIPKAKDMLTCNVVDEYEEMWPRQEKVPKRKKKQRLHMVPFRIVIRPLEPPRLQKPRRPKREQKQTRDNTIDMDIVDSPLKHLGQPHRRQKILKLSADYGKFKRGNSSKGFQHMYHRDEVYNDHIFYDELQTNGEYHNYGKEKIH